MRGEDVKKKKTHIHVLFYPSMYLWFGLGFVFVAWYGAYWESE